MQPSEFWACDTWSVMDAYEGYAMSKGLKSNDTLNKDDIDELRQMMEEADGRHR